MEQDQDDQTVFVFSSSVQGPFYGNYFDVVFEFDAPANADVIISNLEIEACINTVPSPPSKYEF